MKLEGCGDNVASEHVVVFWAERERGSFTSLYATVSTCGYMCVQGEGVESNLPLVSVHCSSVLDLVLEFRGNPALILVES